MKWLSRSPARQLRAADGCRAEPVWRPVARPGSPCVGHRWYAGCPAGLGYCVVRRAGPTAAGPRSASGSASCRPQRPPRRLQAQVKGEGLDCRWVQGCVALANEFDARMLDVALLPPHTARKTLGTECAQRWAGSHHVEMNFDKGVVDLDVQGKRLCPPGVCLRGYVP